MPHHSWGRVQNPPRNWDEAAMQTAATRSVHCGLALAGHHHPVQETARRGRNTSARAAAAGSIGLTPHPTSSVARAFRRSWSRSRWLVAVMPMAIARGSCLWENSPQHAGSRVTIHGPLRGPRHAGGHTPQLPPADPRAEPLRCPTMLLSSRVPWCGTMSLVAAGHVAAVVAMSKSLRCAADCRETRTLVLGRRERNIRREQPGVGDTESVAISFHLLGPPQACLHAPYSNRSL